MAKIITYYYLRNEQTIIHDLSNLLTLIRHVNAY